MTKKEIINKLENYNVSQWKKIGRCLLDSNKQFPENFPESYTPSYLLFRGNTTISESFLLFIGKSEYALNYKINRTKQIHRAFVIILAYEYPEHTIAHLMLETRCWNNIDLFRAYFKVLVEHIPIE